MFRSILAVAAGYVVLAVLTVVSIYVLTLAFPEYARAGELKTTPPTLPVVLNMLLGVVCAACGGWVTAALAARKPWTHALVLAGLVLLFGIAFAVQNWAGPHPEWYLVVLPFAGAAGVVAGGAWGARGVAA